MDRNCLTFSHSVQPNVSNQAYLEPRKLDTLPETCLESEIWDMCQAQPSSFIQSNTGFLSCHPLLPLPSITSFLFFYIPSLIAYPLKACLGWFNIIFWPLKLAWTLLTSIPLHKSDLPCLLIWLWLPIFIFSLGSPACCWKQHKPWTRAQLSQHLSSLSGEPSMQIQQDPAFARHNRAEQSSQSCPSLEGEKWRMMEQGIWFRCPFGLTGAGNLEDLTQFHDSDLEVMN